MRLLFLILFLTVYSASAQKQNIKFAHLQPEHGLSHSYVSAILQDKNGFMWFGTMDGLNKYDGYSFTIYKNDPSNKNSLSHNYILDMIFDKEGNMWLGSWGGLTKFDLKTGTFVQYKQNAADPNSLPNDLVSAIEEDEYGNLWLGTAGGLVLFDRKNNKFITYSHNKNDPESIGDDYVRDIHFDSEKRLWVGTFKGGLNLFNYKTGKFKRYLHDDTDSSSIAFNCAYNIFEDSQKRFWVSNHLNGFDLLDRETGKFKHYFHDPENPNTVAHEVVSCFGEDKEGNLWIGTENGGLSILNHKTQEFSHYQKDEIDNSTLANNSLYAIYKDIRGNMWVGTHAGGVHFYSLEGNKFRHYKHTSDPESLTNNIVLCFFEDSRKNLWIGTDGGGACILNRKTKTFTSFKHDPANKNSICANYVLSIREDYKGNIWFGTWGSGISIYDPEKKTFSHIKHDPANPSSLSINNAWIVYRSKNNQYYVGTYRGAGLELYDEKTNSFRFFSHDPADSTSISNNYVNTIYEDSRGHFWIGTRGGGLNLFDVNNKKFKSFIKSDRNGSISSNNVFCIYEDSKGNLWIGTDLGLNLFDPVTRKFKVFNTKDGLQSNNICGIQEDQQGNLWISSIGGLSRFNYKNKSFTYYTVADGLQSQEFKPHSYYKSKDGRMYFGGINGFNEFHPDSLFNDTTDAPIFITSFKVFNKAINVGDTLDGKVLLKKHLAETENIVLRYDQSFFSFEFATLNYSPDKNQYAYLLEGLDKDWNYVGKRRFASYTDVPPGTYTFRVRGTNSAGQWMPRESFITITVTPPFWKTWWFESLCLFTIIASIFAFYRGRMTSIENQKKILEKQVEERTIDLQEAAKEIELQRDSLKQINEHVMSSINYANTMQKAILVTEEEIEATVEDYFIIFKPKDVVSGDFYWFSHIPAFELNNNNDSTSVQNDQRFVAAIDCTGHGVSGAFMSVIGNTMFNEIINQKHVIDPATILEILDKNVKRAISQSGDVRIAGMDVCLCKLEYLDDVDGGSVKVSFAGARRPLYYVRRGSDIIEKIQGDIISIGSDYKNDLSFTTREVTLPRGSMIYLTTDGFADQHNLSNEKIGSGPFSKLLEKFHGLPLNQQKQILEDTFSDHQQGVEQRDDVTVIGVRL